MLENPDPVKVSSESSKPQDGTEEFLGPDDISRLSTTGVRQAADLKRNLSVRVGAAAQSNVSTTEQSEEGAKAFPEAPKCPIENKSH